MMKKLIAFTLACLMVLSLASCSGESEITTDTPSTQKVTDKATEDITYDDNTAPVEDQTASADTEVPETDAQTDGLTQAPKVTQAQTQAPVETQKPSTVTTAKPEQKPTEDKPLDTKSAEELFFDAVAEFEKLSSFDNAFSAKLTGSMTAGASISYNVSGKQSYKAKKGDDFDCAFDMTVKDMQGEETTANVYYTDGYTYDTIDGCKFRQKMTREEFLEYTLGNIGAVDISFFGFESYEKSKSSDGYKVKFSGLNAETLKKLEDLAKSMDSEVSVSSVTGEASINASGYLTKLTVKIDATLKYKKTMNIPVKVEAELNTTNHNKVSSVALPKLNGYKNTSDLSGLKALSAASETVHTMLDSGSATLEISETANVTGGAKLTADRKTSVILSHLMGKTFSFIGNGNDGAGTYTFKIVANALKITVEDRNGKNEIANNTANSNAVLEKYLVDTVGDVKYVDTFSSKAQGNGKQYIYGLSEAAGEELAKHAFTHLNGVNGITESTKYTYKVNQCSGTTAVDANGAVTEYTCAAKITYTVNGNNYTVDYSAKVTVK